MSDRADNFNRADQATFGTPSDAGAAWANDGGNCDVVNGAARMYITLNPPYLQASSATGDVQCTVLDYYGTGGSGVSIGPMGRRVDNSNWLSAEIYIGPGGGTAYVYLHKKVAGSRTTISSVTTADVLPVPVKLSMTGNTLKVYTAGALQITQTDSANNTGTTHGLIATAGNNYGAVDDWSFTDTGGAGAAAAPNRLVTINQAPNRAATY